MYNNLNDTTMSKYTKIDKEAFIYGVSIDRASELKEAIEEAQERVNAAKAHLRTLVAATPKDMFPDNAEGSTFEKLSFTFDKATEEYEDAVQELTRLYVIKANEENIADKYEDLRK